MARPRATRPSRPPVASPATRFAMTIFSPSAPPDYLVCGWAWGGKRRVGRVPCHYPCRRRLSRRRRYRRGPRWTALLRGWPRKPRPNECRRGRFALWACRLRRSKRRCIHVANRARICQNTAGDLAHLTASCSAKAPPKYCRRRANVNLLPSAICCCHARQAARASKPRRRQIPRGSRGLRAKPWHACSSNSASRSRIAGRTDDPRS